MSRLLTNEYASSAVSSLYPAIYSFLANQAKREALAVVILDPASPKEPSVLYQYSFGDPNSWERDYMKLALGKAEVCLREKCDSGTVVTERPFCLQEGDPPFMGGVYVQGLVVACSGVEGYFDQMFARWIAAALRAISTHRLETEVVGKDLYAVPAAD